MSGVVGFCGAACAGVVLDVTGKPLLTKRRRAGRPAMSHSKRAEALHDQSTHTMSKETVQPLKKSTLPASQ